MSNSETEKYKGMTQRDLLIELYNDFVNIKSRLESIDNQMEKFEDVKLAELNKKIEFLTKFKNENSDLRTVKLTVSELDRYKSENAGMFKALSIVSSLLAIASMLIAFFSK